MIDETPTPEALREFIHAQGWTGGQAAHIVGVDGRTVRKWIGGERGIPLSAWRLLQLAAGSITLEEILSTMPERLGQGRPVN